MTFCTIDEQIRIEFNLIFLRERFHFTWQIERTPTLIRHFPEHLPTAGGAHLGQRVNDEDEIRPKTSLNLKLTSGRKVTRSPIPRHTSLMLNARSSHRNVNPTNKESHKDRCIKVRQSMPLDSKVDWSPLVSKSAITNKNPPMSHSAIPKVQRMITSDQSFGSCESGENGPMLLMIWRTSKHFCSSSDHDHALQTMFVSLWLMLNQLKSIERYV